MLKDPTLTGQDGHLNLFLTEEYENREKDRMSKNQIENMYLKRTSNLGELFDKESNPWYSNKNKQISKLEEVAVKETPKVNHYETKHMLRIGNLSIFINYSS